jgi:hypothetical protein
MSEPVHIGDAMLYLGDCLKILPTLNDLSPEDVLAKPRRK